jgi:Concanavalin A-like lectin/glucanases superfamily/Putative Ig domain
MNRRRKKSLFFKISNLIFVTIIYVSCSPGGSSLVDDIFGGDSVGDSAFVATPSSIDFGNVAVFGSVSKSFVIKNASRSSTFISTMTTNASLFQVVSNTCPQSPAAVAVRYGTKEDNASQFVTNFGISGTGVSPLVFAGLQSLGSQTNKTMTLSWTANTDATSYIIFRMIGPSMVFEKTVLNTGGIISSDVVTGLLPSTSYTWRVRAVDVFGASDNNTTDHTASTSVNQLPLLLNPGAQTLYQGSAWSVNINDSNTSSDSDIDGDVITYSCYYDTVVDGTVGTGTACSTLMNENATAATFNTNIALFSWTPPFAVTPGTQYEMKVIGTDPYGGIASRIFVATVNSGIPILASTPASDFIFPSNFISSTIPLAFDLYNNRTGTDSGVTSYACVFDRIIDDAMVGSSACSALPGTASFNTTTGVLNWTPLTTTWGPYEIYVTATNTAGTDSKYIKVNVRSAVTTTSLSAYWDASFADGEKFGANSPLITQWKNLTTAATTNDGVLNLFGGVLTSGWNNTLTPSLYFDGTNDHVLFGNILAASTSFSVDTWIQSKAMTSSVLFSNADNAGLGLTLKQSNVEAGKFVLVAGRDSFEDEILADNPDGYWRFNEPVGRIAYDISGHHYHGSYTPTGVTRAQVGGLSDADYAVTLDGSNGSMNAPLAITADVSIEIWAQTTTVAGSPMLWRTGANGVGPDLFFYNGKISLNTWNADANSFCNMPAAVTDGQFHQYVVTIDSVANDAKLYFDGALCGTATYRNASAPSITFSSGLGLYEWNGKIDEAAVYSTILTPARVLAHYNAKTRATCRSSMATSLNQWNHIFASYNDATKNLNLWINGRNQCTSSHPTTLAGSAQSFVLGQSATGTSSWNGQVGEIRTYASSSSTPASNNFSISESKYSQYIPMANMRLWFKADSLTYLGNGTPVSYWKDQSGANNHAIQGTGADQPSFLSSGINGMPAVNFNNQCLLTQSPEILGDYTTFVVFKDDGVISNYERILDKDYIAGFWMGRDDGFADVMKMGVMQSSAPYGTTNSFPDNVAHIMTTQRSGTTHTIYAEGANAVTQTVSSSLTSNSVYGIGCWYNANASQRFGGLISEVIVYNSPLSTADRLRVERYLGSKYSIAVP